MVSVTLTESFEVKKSVEDIQIKDFFLYVSDWIAFFCGEAFSVVCGGAQWCLSTGQSHLSNKSEKYELSSLLLWGSHLFVLTVHVVISVIGHSGAATRAGIDSLFSFKRQEHVEERGSDEVEDAHVGEKEMKKE